MKKKTDIIVNPERKITLDQQKKLQKLLLLRNIGFPVAYLIKEKEFWSLPLLVSNVTMIPRPETEHLVELALKLANKKKGLKILDLGTGAGPISLALAKELQSSFIVGTDIDESVISIARSNASNLSIRNVKFLKSNWFDCFHEKKKKFDLIVSNPPYISKDDPCLKLGDLRYEPRRALISSDNGLFDIRIIVKDSKKFLKKNGWLLIEHGCNQGKKVREFFMKSSYQKIKTIQDYSGQDRVTFGRY
ncbi:peptide chain release factor N(5)-glutamine methyltransferase [Candidatus Riesia pediculicola]|uniref:peptide chain release factor N(5)-glutamine methyltransferase n=1 Tax=Candidatus Riesia pediculicola TaxID=401619 RepID=UPI0009E4C3A1|nr:peptide chain release factor N(5)-glutamine methyltransferase [Candidatus Riesia pediculicola]